MLEEQDGITITKISNNPGILPYKLGTAKIKDNTWTLVKTIKIEPLLEEYHNLRNMANKLNSSYYEEKSEKWYITEMHNYRYIIDHLQEEIENLIEQILPNHRQRRGIINGLGSIIKVITGNMDQEDAERINQQIQDLQQGQKNNAKVLKKQISLAKNAIVSFNNTISNLKHNQVILESRILQISKIITESQKYSNRYDIVLQSIVYSQLTNNFSIILRILSEIRTALVFSRINVMHPSIIEPHLLIRDFTSITDSQSTLPINPTTANIMILESLIDIKAYQQHSTITFLLEVPLVSKETYDLYHLYSLPIPINNAMKFIIPTAHYVLYNEQYYGNLNDNCKEILPAKFLCSNIELLPISPESPCEIQIIMLTNQYQNCKQISMNLKDVKTQKIENNNWIVVSPHQNRLTSYCNDNQYIKLIEGTNIIHIPLGCSISINGKIIKNAQLVRSSQNKPLQFEYNIEISKNSSRNITINSLSLERINLGNTNRILEDFNTLEEELESVTPLITSNPSIWTIILYVILIIMLLYIIIRIVKGRKLNSFYCFTKKVKSGNDPQNLNTQEFKF